MSTWIGEGKASADHRRRHGRAGLEVIDRRIPEQRGQSTIEFGVSALVLILILVGLIDLGRAFYFDVALHGAVREGARHGIWFDASAQNNPYLYDDAIKGAVDGILARSGLPASALQNPGTTCPVTADANTIYDPPYTGAAYGSPAVNQPLLYICYDNTPGLDLTAAPTDNSYRARDLNVILVMRFGSVTGLLQQQFAENIRLVANTHMSVGGY